jgi:hypothetical protein
MISLVRAEFLKLRTTQVWFWLFVATIGVSALLVVAQVAPHDGIRTEAKVPDLITSFAAGPGYILVFVLGVLGVTTEFRYQTITVTVLQTPSRWAVVTAKMITYAVVGAVFALFAMCVEIAIGVPWLSSKHVKVHFGADHVQHALWAVFVVVVLFAIVGLGVGALLRNQIVAVVVGIVFLLAIENLLLLVPGVKHAWPYMPGAAAQAILYTNGDNSPVSGVHLLSTTGGVIALLLWAFIPAIGGAAYSMNRDIT